jgi:hypothetical protein
MRWRVLLTVAWTFAFGACSSSPRDAAAPPRPTREPAALSTKPEWQAAAELYRKQKTLENLERLVAHLEPEIPRKEVERALGAADVWDDPAWFYGSDRANLAGEPLGLTLDFSLWFTDGRPSQSSEQLERFSLGPGSRFLSADSRIAKRKPPAPDPARTALEPAAAHYRTHRDYASLQSLVRGLRLGTPRVETETLLGAGKCHSPDKTPCRYTSDRKNAAGLPLGLTIDYSVHNVDGTHTVVTDVVEALTFGPAAD